MVFHPCSTAKTEKEFEDTYPRSYQLKSAWRCTHQEARKAEPVGRK
jgi:hypothetical protein